MDERFGHLQMPAFGGRCTVALPSKVPEVASKGYRGQGHIRYPAVACGGLVAIC